MELGVIGTGDMGIQYAKNFASAGYKVNCCDLPEKRSELEEKLRGIGNIDVLNDGVAVSRASDVIFYLVPVEGFEEAVARYGPSTKKDAIVSSGASVMSPAIRAFERYLPRDVNIINWHWLFGPSINPKGQATAVVNHKSSKQAYMRAMEAFGSIGTNIIELPSYEVHDKITADTQAVTHVAYLSMGSAWAGMGSFPWVNTTYAGGIDNVKVLMTLRIYSGKSHVYSGLAIHNPFAWVQVMQYAKSVSELFGLMIQEKEAELRDRIERAAEVIFGGEDSPIYLDDKVMGDFSLGIQEGRTPNSHLSQLAMIDAWHKLSVNPYYNMVCQTPVFRLRLGTVEYLWRNRELFDESISTALFSRGIRADDLEFHTAVREWASLVAHGDTAGYHEKFGDTKSFFPEGMLLEGMRKSSELIRRLS